MWGPSPPKSSHYPPAAWETLPGGRDRARPPDQGAISREKETGYTYPIYTVYDVTLPQNPYSSNSSLYFILNDRPRVEKKSQYTQIRVQ